MPIRNLKIPSAARSKLGVPDILDITDQLPVNPKYTWDKLIGGPRDPSKIGCIVLHHDALSKSSSAGISDMTFASNIASSHIRSTKNEAGGDPGFPYHFWIRNGQVYQTNDLLSLTYGVKNNNGYTVHICVSGDYFGKDVLTEPDRRALLGSIEATKAVLNIRDIRGHGEIQPTNCPGYSPDAIRAAVADLESELEFQESDLGATANAVALKTRVDDLYSKLNSTNRQAAILKLDKLYKYAIDSGIIMK
ncbi:N-acetylmuramoyl-L-alanine amidase [Gorillibacterium sp. CAU 1737]|uniref:peptidoglycan recognition protein family protein n=1 Tax=Gorillibacterium sp. CAU 1737 TaxID=3140362 RepID=UPI003260276A